MPQFYRRRADPKNVAAIILGGGAGTKLFPLTSRAATPAVRYIICTQLYCVIQHLVLDQATNCLVLVAIFFSLVIWFRHMWMLFKC